MSSDLMADMFGAGEKLSVKNYADMVKAAEGLISESDVRVLQIAAGVSIETTYVCLSKEHIDKLGLLKGSIVKVKMMDELVERQLYKGAEIELNGRCFVMDVMENEEGLPDIIGSLFLDAVDFVVNPDRKVVANPAHEGKWIVYSS